MGIVQAWRPGEALSVPWGLGVMGERGWHCRAPPKPKERTWGVQGGVTLCSRAGPDRSWFGEREREVFGEGEREVLGEGEGLKKGKGRSLLPASTSQSVQGS